MIDPISALPSLSVYVHWPICLAKCPYCDFNSHVRAAYDAKAWAAAIITELQWYRRLVPDARPVGTIFFGGGTPSLIPPHHVGAIIEAVDGLWGLTPDVEITLEANPTSAEAANFRQLQSLGVNRFSLGIQALNDHDLAQLGREHSVAEALKAYDILCNLMQSGDRVSFDLIYARSAQTLAAWEHELQQALALHVGHLSLYQLTIEPGTAFYTAHQAGRLVIPDDDRAAEFYELTETMTQAHGVAAYEVSNYARKGLESRHNLAYWQYHDYIGVGPGAHGRLTRNGVKYATVGHKAPETWSKAVAEQGVGSKPMVPLTAYDTAVERLMMGLRLRQGIVLDHPLFHTPSFKACLDTMIAEHYLILTPEGEHARLTATFQGALCLTSVLNYLVQGLPETPSLT